MDQYKEKRNLFFLFVLILAAAKSLQADDFWTYWGDGKAELSGYALTQSRYNQLRKGKAVLIFVTEDHSEKEKVKIEGDPAGIPQGNRFSVLKLNFIRTFQTGIYDYKVMTSVFTRIDQQFQPSKISMGVQEWCGHVYHQWVICGKELQEVLHSYFGGEGDQVHGYMIPTDSVFEDALPILIRELREPWLKPGESRTVKSAPSMIGLRFNHKSFSWEKLTIEKAASSNEISTVLGPKKAFRWTVTSAFSGVTAYYVEANYPRRILKWVNDKGESAELTGTTRLPYWTLHANGDEKYLKTLFPKESHSQ